MVEYSECPLCRQAREIVVSHIIPKWCYRRSFNQKGQLKIAYLNDENAPRKPMQDGFKEHLLCRECEGKFSKLETVAEKALNRPPEPQIDVGFSCGIHGISAVMLKRFLLSVVWRMSISKAPIFQAVRLGERHQEGLRSILANDGPIAAQPYPTLIYRLMANGGELKDLIYPPSTERIDGHWTVRMIFSGYLFQVFTTSHSVPREWEVYLLKDVPWIKIHRKDIGELPWLRSAYMEFKEAGRI